MVRAVLVSVLAVAACKGDGGKGSDPPAQGVAAGKVVEATGTVTASRDGKTRPLAAGNDVTGDDTVATGADGHVVIRLAHNNATWDLSANKSERVDKSLAWTLAKQDTPAATVDQATSAAGRHAERSAADTVATADTKAAAEPAPPPPAPAAQAAPPADEKKPAAEITGAPNPNAALQHAVDQAKPTLAKCLPAKTHLKMTISVMLGSVTFEFAGKPPGATVRACLEKAIHALGTDGDAKIDL